MIPLPVKQVSATITATGMVKLFDYDTEEFIIAFNNTKQTQKWLQEKPAVVIKTIWE